jgi:hypothetical protein
MLKKIFNTLGIIFIGLPNLPFAIIISIYVLYNIYKNNSIVEIEISQDKGESLITDEIKEYIKKVYPTWLMVLVALYFWYLILF